MLHIITSSGPFECKFQLQHLTENIFLPVKSSNFFIIEEVILNIQSKPKCRNHRWARPQGSQSILLFLCSYAEKLKFFF